MKKIIIFFILFFSFLNIAISHPLDISVSTWNIKWKLITVTTYFHSFEIEYLLKNNWIVSDWVLSYFNNSEIIKNYVKDNSSFYNNGKRCIIKNIEIQESEAYLILSNWLWVDYLFLCDNEIEKFKIDLSFFKEFPLQTNRITFFNLNNWIKNIKPILYKVLTSKITFIDLDLNNLNINRLDTDWDGLSDEEEKLYYTDIKKIDTDWDNYTDKEEVDYWWNPIDSNLWPSQNFREFLNIEISNKNIAELEKINKKIWEKNLSDYWYGNNYLKDVMKYINNYFEKWDWNLLVVFWIVFLLWMLHAAWPWHSKWLLIAYTLEKENWYYKWLLFSFVFTITHILDIIILFLITTVLFSYIDQSKYVYYIQLFSWIVLFFLSIFLIYSSFRNNKECKKKPSLSIAFLAWLAPCSFAWSIYLLLIAIWKTSWIFPLIVALWFWIFTTLVLIVIISVYLKTKIYNKIIIFWKYSTIFSSIIIFIISLFILYKIL